MRLTLLLFCLFSILGGCAASSCHGVVVPKLIRFSEKQHSSLQFSAHQSAHGAVLANDDASAYFVADDIEEDDDRESLSLKKYYVQANDAFASAQLASLSRILRFGFDDALVPSESSRKYISLCTFRV